MEIELGDILFMKSDPDVRWKATKVEKGTLTECVYVGASPVRLKGEIAGNNTVTYDEIKGTWEIDLAERFNSLLNAYYGDV